MTSEAPQDVAALLRELAEAALSPNWAGEVHDLQIGAEWFDSDAAYIAALSPDVVLGLLDQNDRLRSALRYLWGAELPIAAAIRAQQDVGDAMTVRDVFVHGIEGDPLVTDIDALLAAR